MPPKISPSGFYDRLKREPSGRKSGDGCLKSKILGIFGKTKGRYGSPRIRHCLRAKGERVGKDRVARLMREEGLVAKGKKAFRPKTTVNDPNDRKSPRLFKTEGGEPKGRTGSGHPTSPTCRRTPASAISWWSWICSTGRSRAGTSLVPWRRKTPWQPLWMRSKKLWGT